MLKNPDIAPSASINRWIVSILMFHFELLHVPGTHHGPDGLSRQQPQSDDKPEPEDNNFEDWVNNVNSFIHMVNPYPTDRSTLTDIPPITCFITDTNRQDSPTPETAQGTTDDTTNTDNPTNYNIVPRTDTAIKADKRLLKIQPWLETLKQPDNLTDAEYKTFIRHCTKFFIANDRLWRKDPKGHKMVIFQNRRLFIINSAHNDTGHHGFFATNALIAERYWWPHMAQDIAWFILTCHICQVRKTQQVLIPPIIAMPAPLFSKVYMDTMHMLPSSSYKYIVQGRCSLIYWPEWAMLITENAKSLARWILHDIIYRWGLLLVIVTDNGPAFLKALKHLEEHYHIKHIRISGYNSRANRLVERSRFEVREAIFKACDGNESKWSTSTYSVFWAEWVTICRRMGCSPYFAATGTHPLLPVDISEANYLLPAPISTLLTTDLIARRAITLQKRRDQLAKLRETVYQARVKAAIQFKKEHAHTIKIFDFKLGDLVLVQNTAIEKALNRKMRPQYLGPLIVISRNRGGVYILAELDGSVFDRPIAAFRVIPYFAQKSITLPPLDKLLDISWQCLAESENTEEIDTNDGPPDDTNLLADD